MTYYVIILIIILVLYILSRKVEEHGILYESFPMTTRFSHASFPNPRNKTRGYVWTATNQLSGLEYNENGKNSVYIDNFKMDKDFVKKANIPSFLKNKYEKFAVGFDPLVMTQSLLIIGKMGAGKTEIAFSFLNQKFYNRAIIHQIKLGDFVEPYYREGFDYILNPYDSRGTLWDVMSESEGIIKTFFENYMNAVMGDKKDFFSSAANRKYNETMQKIKIQYKDATSAQKWMMFIKAIKDLFQEMETGDQNSSKDVGSTMEQVIEPLEIMAWQMQQKTTRSFTIKEFFDKKDQCKLILDNNAEFEKALTPLFSAFLAAFSQVQMSRPDSKTDFTLYALDEFLSLAATLDDSSKNRLFTAIRGKGGILMSFVQYIPRDDKKLQQKLTSSCFAWFIFSITEPETIDLVNKAIGKVEYNYYDESKNAKDKTVSLKETSRDVITNDILNALATEFAHLVYIPNENILYKGYTPRAVVPSRNEKSILRDLTPFYTMKYKGDDEEIEDISNMKFEDIFAIKKMSKLDEYKMYKKYQQYKKVGKESEFKEKEVAPQFKKQKIDFEMMFEKFMPQDTVIDNKMKLFSPKERFELMTKWNEIEDNLEAQLEFLEKNELFGAVPGIFDNLDGGDVKSAADDF